MRIDVHQHVWTPPLVAALKRRHSLPLIREDHGATLVECEGELPWGLEADGEHAEARAALLDTDGLDAAIVAISSPIGIEALPREEALELIEAQLAGVAALGPRFGAWAPLPTDRPRPEDVDRLLPGHPLGISLPSGALASPTRVSALAPVLARIAELALPLFIHPGRAHGDRVSTAELGDPPWWPALTDYVAGMQAAWLSWQAAGARAHPELTVVFAMLAGLAPLQSERLAARGGPAVDLADPHVFYDTSSYGVEAVAAMTRHIPTAQLLYGSDRPVVQPASHPLTRTLQTHAGRVFGPAFQARGLAPGVSTPVTR